MTPRRTADAFASWVSTADSAMLAVTARAGDELDASLVGFHSQASIHPLRYVVWLSKENHTTGLARRADVLGIHLIGRDQLDIARQLGGITMDDHPDKMTGLRRRRTPSGAVHLVDLPIWFAGKIERRIDGGDHIGHVLSPLSVGRQHRPQRDLLRLADVEDVIEPGHPDH